MTNVNDGDRLPLIGHDTDAALTETERAEITLNSIGDAVISTDMPGNVTYLNAVAERMTGWPREEAVGRPLCRVFQIVDGATRETCPNPMDLAVRMNRTVGLTSNCVLIRRDGFETAIVGRLPCNSGPCRHKLAVVTRLATAPILWST